MSFYFRRNLLIITLVLILLGIIGFLVQALTSLFFPSAPSAVLNSRLIAASEQNYSEKIDNFSLQNFNNKHQLLHLIEAKHYFNLTNAPALLLKPKVSVYGKNGAIEYDISAKRAFYLNNKQVEFIGTVNINSKTGAKHIINTEALLVDTDTFDLSNDTPLTYLGENLRIAAQGMFMDADKNLLQLLGDVKILQNSGSKISTQNLHIDQSGGQQYYQTKHPIRYQSSIADISAKGMLYQVKAQKIKLTGGVVGHYNNDK